MGEGLVNLVDDATNVVERNELTSPVRPVHYTLNWDWRQKGTVSLWFDMMAEITLNRGRHEFRAMHAGQHHV